MMVGNHDDDDDDVGDLKKCLFLYSHITPSIPRVTVMDGII